MKVACVVGARPNFMKIGPVIEAMRAYPGLVPFLVHTGQHYDDAMSRVFFEDLGLPRPDVYLGVGSDSHTRQTAKVMTAFEELALEHRPDYVLVVGDVNSTLAAALVASKLRIRLGHVESGLRSFDRDMPEEINRLVTDAVADDLYTSCADAAPNLLREGRVPGADPLRGQRDDRLARAPPRARGVERRDGIAGGDPPRLHPGHAASAEQRGRAGDVSRDPGRLGTALPRDAGALPGAPAHAEPHRRVRAG